MARLTSWYPSDIYTSHTKNQEHFRKADSGIPLPDDGISLERDPVKHRRLAKKLAGAWSTKSLNLLEPIMHAHIDLFIQKLRLPENGENGIDLRVWTDRLAMDMSSQLAYGREMGQLETGNNAPLLDTFWDLNFFITINRISSKFLFLSPLRIFCIPLKVLFSHFCIERLNREAVNDRIARRHERRPLDLFDYMLPSSAPAPVGHGREHFEVLAGHLLVGGFEAISGQYHCALVFLLLQPDLLRALQHEVRTTFARYQDTIAEFLTDLPFLNAVINGTLRMTVNVAATVPRESPGAEVEATYIPNGVVVHFAHFAFTRSSRYIHEGRSFRPQRWLPREHYMYDAAYANDAIASFHPFGHRPRSCIAVAQVWRQLRLYLAKVTWALDLMLVPGQDFSFERDSRLYAMWEKPRMLVQLRPTNKRKLDGPGGHLAK